MTSIGPAALFLSVFPYACIDIVFHSSQIPSSLSEATIVVPGVKESVVKALLDFLYTGEMWVERKDTADLQLLIETLQIDPNLISVDTLEEKEAADDEAKKEEKEKDSSAKSESAAEGESDETEEKAAREEQSSAPTTTKARKRPPESDSPEDAKEDDGGGDVSSPQPPTKKSKE